MTKPFFESRLTEYMYPHMHAMVFDILSAGSELMQIWSFVFNVDTR